MLRVLNDDVAASVFQWMDAVEAARLEEAAGPMDLVELSDEARSIWDQAKEDTMVAGAMSLESMQNRINTVRAEIAQVWNSALPDEEKYRLITSKENEISLLQAGQFEFARAGFHKVA